MANETYRGVEITDTYFTGGWTAVLPTLKRSIVSICRRDRSVSDFYIGIASGIDYWEALKRRIDGRKEAWGVTHMYLLYQSSSRRNTAEVEKNLIEHFRTIDYIRLRNDPKSKGGEGGPSTGPLYFVYLALRRAA